MVQTTLKHFPENKPRYLMGVGSPKELVESALQGVDVFDSIFPTRTARHGQAFSSKGNLNLKNGQYKTDLKPLDLECECMVCQQYSKALLHHLVRTNEENGLMYLSHHNLFFIKQWMNQLRTAILENDAKTLKKMLAYPASGRA